MIVSGNFSVLADTGPVGVWFYSTVSGSITINGNFSLCSYGRTSGNSAYDVTFSAAPSGTCTGTPTFYSNNDDKGNWTSYGGGITWNGGSDISVTDAAFTLTQVRDTPPDDSANAHFVFLAVSAATRTASKTDFNNRLINAFQNLSDGYIAWSVLTTNIRNLLS
jgi:hypothetical protein